jgi:hypothetical protein
MTNYLNEEDEEDKYSSEEKISDDVPQIEVDSTDNEEWGTDEEDDDWGGEEVETGWEETSDEVEEPTDDGEDGEVYGDDKEGYDDESTDTMKEPSTAEINAEPSEDQPKGFRVLSFEDFVSNK